MKLTMSSDEKNSVEPAVPVNITSTKGLKQKFSMKHVLIGVGLLVVLGLVITAILVGMHINSTAQLDLIKYTLKLSGGGKQDIESDKTNNYVKYHVKDGNHEAWIIADFSTDIRVTKIETATESNCYISPLNRSNVQEPSKISVPNTNTPKLGKSNPVVFTTNGQPVQDLSFLNKQAQEMCKGVSTYWMYPSCASNDLVPANHTISKREAPYYVQYNVKYAGYYYPCINGCCKTVCACKISYTYYVNYDNEIYCNWVYYSCCQGYPCFSTKFCEATPGLEGCSSDYC